MEPFLFRSYYYCVKGQAENISELESEMKRLSRVDPGCVRWHFECDHITQWIRYIGENRLADRVSKATNLQEAIETLSRTTSRRKATSGRKPSGKSKGTRPTTGKSQP